MGVERSTRDNPYITMHFQFLPYKNHSFASSLASSLVTTSLVTGSSSSLPSVGVGPNSFGEAGSDSLGGAGSELDGNSLLDSWAASKASLNWLATMKHLLAFDWCEIG